MEKKQKKDKSKYIILIFGLIVLAVGIVMLVNGIKQYNQMNVDYQAAYDKWHTDWRVNNTATLEDMPERPGAPLLLFLGPIATFLGVALSIMGTIALVAVKAVDDIGESAKRKSGIFGVFDNMNKPQKRVCNYCGTENKLDATRCSSCGAGLTDKK